MTVEEMASAFEELKAKGMSEEEIVLRLGLMFCKDMLDRNQFEAVLHVLGWDLNDKVKKMSDSKLKRLIEVENGLLENCNSI